MSGRTSDAVQSAVEIAVDYALTGSLRPVEDRLRVAVQLVAARSRTWAWAERYELDKATAVSSQDSIISGILGAKRSPARPDRGLRRASSTAL